jgi:hypothetical protein
LDEYVIPETHVFTGDVIALQEWGEATLEHYEKAVGGFIVLYDGKDAGIVYTDWQSEKDPSNAWAQHDRPEVTAIGPINEGDTVTYGEKTGFGMKPSPVKASQLALDGLSQKWEAAYDRPDPFDELDRIESIARHPSNRADSATAAVHRQRL